LKLNYLDNSELQNGTGILLGHSASDMNGNALDDNVSAEANAMPTSELWGDIGLDLNDSWGLF
jgi:hypothetical protein